MTRRWALIIDLVILIALWHIAAESWDKNFLPAPVEVLTAFLDEMGNGMAEHILASTRRVFASTILGAVLAAPVAIFTAQSQRFDQFVTPLMYFAYPAPKVVFLPIILLFLGLEDESKVFLITLIIFFQVFVIVRDAARQVPPQTLDSVQSLGATRWHLLRYVYFPVSLPAVLTALKVSTGTAIAVLFIAESFATRTGLGHYIQDNSVRFAYPEMYAGILAMSMLGLVLFGLLSYLENRVSRWRENHAGA